MREKKREGAGGREGGEGAESALGGNNERVRAVTKRASRSSTYERSTSGRIAGYRLFSLVSRLDNAFDPRNSFVIMNATEWIEKFFFSALYRTILIFNYLQQNLEHYSRNV